MDTTTPLSTGTSLEVLKQYVFSKVDGFTEIEMLGSKERGRLFGVSSSHAYVAFGNDFQRVSFRNLLPILRPFSALCTPLEGGKVPAVALANIILFPFNGWVATEVNENVIEVGFPGFSRMVVRHMIDGEWAIDVWSGTVHQIPGNMCAAYDYLRSRHFAVNLEPHQFIAK